MKPREKLPDKSCQCEELQATKQSRPGVGTIVLVIASPPPNARLQGGRPGVATTGCAGFHCADGELECIYGGRGDNEFTIH